MLFLTPFHVITVVFVYGYRVMRQRISNYVTIVVLPQASPEVAR